MTTGIIIVFAVLVAAAGAGLFFQLRQRRQTAADAAQPAAAQPAAGARAEGAEVNNAGGNSRLHLIIGGVGILVIIVLIVIAALSGNKKTPDSPEVAAAKARIAFDKNLDEVYELEEQAMQSRAEKGRKAILNRNVPLLDGVAKEKLRDYKKGDIILVIHTKRTYKPVKDKKTEEGLGEGMTYVMGPDKNGVFGDGPKGLIPSDSYDYLDDPNKKPSPHPWIDSSSPVAIPATEPASASSKTVIEMTLPDGTTDVNIDVIKGGGKKTSALLPTQACRQSNGEPERCTSISGLKLNDNSIEFIQHSSAGTAIFSGTKQGERLVGTWSNPSSGGSGKFNLNPETLSGIESADGGTTESLWLS